MYMEGYKGKKDNSSKRKAKSLQDDKPKMTKGRRQANRRNQEHKESRDSREGCICTHGLVRQSMIENNTRAT